MTREALFNTPLESGIRSMIILTAMHPKKCDLHRLVSYDYLLVHSGDIDGGPTSLHPDSPFRSGELVVRRQIVEKGLDLVFRKGLVEKTFEREGILYGASKIANDFLDYFDSPYAIQAISVAGWINERFGSYSDEQLSSFVSDNIGRWGAEFANDPYLEEVSNGY